MEWINRLFIYIMEHYIALKKNEVWASLTK